MTAIEQVQAIVERAREMLATGEVAPPPFGEDPHLPPPYPRKVNEVQAELRRRVWVGTVEDFGTGEGLMVHLAVALDHDEAEFRRRLSLELGRELAHRSEVGVGVEGMP